MGGGIRTRGGIGGEVVIIFLLFLFSHLCFTTSASPSPSSTHSVPLQENNLGEGVAEEKGVGTKGGSRHQLVHSIKIGHGHGGDGGGGAVATRSPGSSGNNGDSTSTAQGGAAVIPVYTAGAVNNHRPSSHHGAASRNLQSLEPLSLCASILGILVLHVCLVSGFEN